MISIFFGTLGGGRSDSHSGYRSTPPLSIPSPPPSKKKKEEFYALPFRFVCERLPKRSGIEVRKTKSSAPSQFDKLEFSLLFLGEML